MNFNNMNMNNRNTNYKDKATPCPKSGIKIHETPAPQNKTDMREEIYRQINTKSNVMQPVNFYNTSQCIRFRSK